ncbi:cytochrome P450 [Streptomyces sp. NPDC003077]|uniref:cytochrome P450 n=1 Tax=Streptomyces sp. NPDC003077 TaxID=3154443 RepID=UPI00339DEB2F
MGASAGGMDERPPRPRAGVTAPDERPPLPPHPLQPRLDATARRGRRHRSRAEAAWRRDPLGCLEAEFDADRDVWRSASGRLFVTGPEAAREVMGNSRGLFVETSDFFHTRYGVFGPRTAQREIGRNARELLRRRFDATRADLPRLVGDRLVPVSDWPDAGNLLVREHLGETLLCPDTSARLRLAVDGVIDRAVRAGARDRHTALARLLFRHTVMRALIAEIRARRAAGTDGAPRDLLDVVVTGGGPAADPAELAEVYLSFLFATVGSIGFALGWSLYLVGTHPGTEDEEPERIVREALRLWPVAWLFARSPNAVHDLAGVTVGPQDEIAVCSYLVHRHPRHWDRPDAFVPSRWAEPVHDPAFLPFGYGPHTCAGATVTMTLLQDLVRVLTRDWHLSVGGEGYAPQVGPALAPPRFTVRLTRRTDTPKGGEG